jgi:hypothetical protein
VFHVRGVALYFLALMIWRGIARMQETGTIATAIVTALSLLPIAIAGLGLLLLLAYLSSRTTVYTITNRRVVLRVGVALPTAINVPFRLVAHAGVHLYRDGSGDIPLALTGPDRIGYSYLWPHVRPWRFNQPQPMLRGIPDAARVATLLGEALRDAMPETAQYTPVGVSSGHRGVAAPMPGAVPASA